MESYLLLIHIHWDKGLLAFHYIGERNAARAAEHPAKLTSADGFVLLVHHEDFPGLSGKVVMFTQIVEHLTNRHIFGHRDKIALPQAAGRFLWIRARIFNGGAIFGRQRRKKGL